MRALQFIEELTNQLAEVNGIKDFISGLKVDPQRSSTTKVTTEMINLGLGTLNEKQERRLLSALTRIFLQKLVHRTKHSKIQTGNLQSQMQANQDPKKNLVGEEKKQEEALPQN